MNKNLRVVPGMIFLLFVTLTEAAAQYEIQTTPVRTHRGYIHLQDGTILKGRYAYSASLEKIRVISDHQIRVFDASEVSRITTRRPSQFASTASPGEVPEMPGLPPPSGSTIQNWGCWPAMMTINRWHPWFSELP